MKTKTSKLSKKAFGLDRGLNAHVAHLWTLDGEPEVFVGSHSGTGIRRAAADDTLGGL